jgi:hypothetical protein
LQWPSRLGEAGGVGYILERKREMGGQEGSDPLSFQSRRHPGKKRKIRGNDKWVGGPRFGDRSRVNKLLPKE